LAQGLGQELAREHLCARFPAEALHTDRRPRAEWPRGADLVQPCNAAPEELPRLGGIKLGRAAVHPGKRGEAELPIPQQRCAADDKRWGDRQLRGGELGGELVLLADLRIAPAPRTVELEHQLPFAHAELIHAIFVAVEREQPPIGLESEGGGGIQHHLGRQPGKRSQLTGTGFVYHRCPMKPASILVTGGAGYIGSHVVLQLRERGERVVVLDDLSRGFRQAVLDAPLTVGNVGDRATVSALLREHEVDTVMHFAAFTIVSESVREPLKYYHNNTCATRTLLECCVAAGVRCFVFSSTAAVYGI